MPDLILAARRGAVSLLAGIALVIGAPLHAQCPDGTPPPCRGRAAPPRPATPDRTPSLAVLYLLNLSTDTTQAPIAEGLTDEIVARLSQVQGVRVMSRYATLRYRGAVVDPRSVGRDLGVRYVLQGTMRRLGDRVRVVVEIADAGGGFNVWAQTYDRSASDLFLVQDSIAVQVVEAVRGRLTGRERARIASGGMPTTPEAYQAYLRGRSAIRGRTAGHAVQAIAFYRRAIALDPGFARAYSGLAHALALARDWGWELPGVPTDSMPALAAAAAARARSLDSLSADTWLALAMAERAFDVRRALSYHRRAVALDSTSVEILHQLAWGFLGVGMLDSAIIVERAAIARDPYYAYAYSGVSEMLNVAGRSDEALAWADQGLAIDSSSAPLYWQVADASLHLGRLAEARAAAERALSLGFDAVGSEVLLALAALKEGDTATAVAMLARPGAQARDQMARSRGGLSYSTAALLSGAYAQLGQRDSALVWAGRVAEWPRRLYVVMFARHWFWEPMRDDPRFQALLAEWRK